MEETGQDLDAEMVQPMWDCLTHVKNHRGFCFRIFTTKELDQIRETVKCIGAGAVYEIFKI